MHNCVGHDTIVGFCERFFFVLLSHGVWTDNASFPVANQVSTLCPPPAPSPPYSGPSAVNPSPYPVPHGLRLPDFHPSPHPGPSPVTSSPIFSSPTPSLASRTFVPYPAYRTAWTEKPYSCCSEELYPSIMFFEPVLTFDPNL